MSDPLRVFKGPKPVGEQGIPGWMLYTMLWWRFWAFSIGRLGSLALVVVVPEAAEMSRVPASLFGLLIGTTLWQRVDRVLMDEHWYPDD